MSERGDQKSGTDRRRPNTVLLLVGGVACATAVILIVVMQNGDQNPRANSPLPASSLDAHQQEQQSVYQAARHDGNARSIGVLEEALTAARQQASPNQEHIAWLEELLAAKRRAQSAQPAEQP